MKELWTPFQRATLTRHQVEQTIDLLISKFPNEPLNREELIEEQLRDEIWLNNLYQVNVRFIMTKDNWPAMLHLSIKSRDKSPIRDWRHMQRIKNEIAGVENEAVELYPAESRLVDTANQYHLWALAEAGKRFPFGFPDRFVHSTPIGNSKQRPHTA